MKKNYTAYDSRNHIRLDDNVIVKAVEEENLWKLAYYKDNHMESPFQQKIMEKQTIVSSGLLYVLDSGHVNHQNILFYDEGFASVFTDTMDFKITVDIGMNMLDSNTSLEFIKKYMDKEAPYDDSFSILAHVSIDKNKEIQNIDTEVYFMDGGTVNCDLLSDMQKETLKTYVKECFIDHEMEYELDGTREDLKEWGFTADALPYDCMVCKLPFQKIHNALHYDGSTALENTDVLAMVMYDRIDIELTQRGYDAKTDTNYYDYFCCVNETGQAYGWHSYGDVDFYGKDPKNILSEEELISNMKDALYAFAKKHNLMEYYEKKPAVKKRTTVR